MAVTPRSEAALPTAMCRVPNALLSLVGQRRTRFDSLQQLGDLIRAVMPSIGWSEILVPGIHWF